METIHHKLQQFDPGIVWLDNNNIIVAMNGVATETFGNRSGELIGQEVLQLHPKKSQDKVSFLLEQSTCPMESPPPMTMMINIPERVLLVKVAKMCGNDGLMGTCMVFYDLTDLTITQSQEEEQPDEERSGRLYKLPVYKNKQILLVDLRQVNAFKAEGHYSTLYTKDDNLLCNLSLSDLERRLDLTKFVRVHRSYLVNLTSAMAFEKVDEQYQLTIESKDQIRIPISRNNLAKVKHLLGLA
ncbi:MAG: LytTR family transcriptional regulator DNA-binding domain-containing protein [Candidatus Thiodiazotropha sp.]